MESTHQKVVRETDILMLNESADWRVIVRSCPIDLLA